MDKPPSRPTGASCWLIALLLVVGLSVLIALLISGPGMDTQRWFPDNLYQMG